MNMMGYGSYGYGMMGYGWGWLMMIGMCILVVLGIIALIRYLRQSARPDDSQAASKTALDILNEIYAKGEISDEEYQRKKSEIKK
jgi:putative membrane protein